MVAGWVLLGVSLLSFALLSRALHRRALRREREACAQREQQWLRERSDALEAQRRAELDAATARHDGARRLAAAANAVREPLDAARRLGSSLYAPTLTPPELQPLAEHIDDALRHAADTLDAVLMLARLDAGEVGTESEAWSAGSACLSLHEEFGALAAARGLQLRVRCPDVWLYGDRTLLRRVLHELLANAVGHTPMGGVLLAGRRRGDALEWQAWDTGPGIASEDRATVFEPFQRLEPPSPWGNPGPGLGLAICERIARRLQLPIGMRSRVGRGSVFWLRVPIATAAQRRQPPPPARELAGWHALCVGADATHCASLHAELRRAGLSVVHADGLEAALLAARAQRPDVLLVDLDLGEALDGLDVLDIVRRDFGSDAPLGAVLGTDDDGALSRRARIAGYPVLHKPVDAAALRALLGALSRATAPATHGC